MKTVVVYYSMSGNTHATAQKIAAALGAELIRLDPVKEYPSKGFRKFIWGGKSAVMGEMPALQPYVFSGDYDRVIFGSPVWASHIAPPLRTFIHENRDALQGKRFACFLCCAGGDADKPFLKLQQLLEADGFDARLVLVDPADKHDPQNDEKIAAFCAKLK